MSIKSQGGIFGRNPTFNDVTVDGDLSVANTLSVNGTTVLNDTTIPANKTLVVTTDIGSTVEAYDATILKSADIGSTVQAYDADTAKLDVAQLWSETQTFGKDIVSKGTTGISSGFTKVYKYGGTAASPTESGDWPYPAVVIRGYGDFTKESMLSFGYSNDADYQTGNDVWNFRLSGTASTTTSSASTNLELIGPGSLVLGAGGASKVTLNSSGNLVMDSGSGIDFSATAGTGTSELFDDYEEGTWTPTDASGAGLTFIVANGWYTKIGRQVTVNGEVRYPVTADTSNATIGSLPFTAASAGYSAGSTMGSTAKIVSTLVVPNVSYIQFFEQGVVGWNYLTNAEQSNEYIYFTHTYWVS